MGMLLRYNADLSSDDVGNPASGIALDYLYLDRDQNFPTHLPNFNIGGHDLTSNVALDWEPISKLDKPGLFPLSNGTHLQHSQFQFILNVIVVRTLRLEDTIVL